MSSASTPLDLNQHLVHYTRRASERLAKDLRALTPEQATQSPGGVARPPVHFVAECAYINGVFAEFLVTGIMNRMTPQERDPHLAGFDTVDKALAYLEEGTTRLIATLETMDVNRLGEVSDKPFGVPTPLMTSAELPAAHMMYHDGQITYLQCLNGDGAVHW